MISAKKIAFVFGRPQLNAAKLQFMPFALSTLKQLAAENNQHTIDVYITQTHSNDYRSLLPGNVNIIFLDNTFVWSKGSGSKLFTLINIYFKYITRNKKYDVVFGIGQLGTVLGGKLAQRKKAKFVCLNDEFPNIAYLEIWKENEKKYLATANIVVLPDESRIEVLKKQVTFNHITRFEVLPNIPLQSDINKLPPINWRQKLAITADAKLVVYAGGIDRENNIDFLLSVFPFTPPDFFLIMVGNGKKYKNNNYLNFERIKWIEEPLSDDELHSLTEQAICSMGYYADFLDLEYVGKSSGKIMRSLLIGTPVIATRFESLKFIEEDGMGILIKKPFELINALQLINSNQHIYRKNIQSKIKQYTFENYWEKIKPSLVN